MVTDDRATPDGGEVPLAAAPAPAKIESPAFKLSKRQVLDLFGPTAVAATTASAVGPIADEALQQAAQAAGAHLVELGPGEPVAGMFARVGIFLVIRGLNKYLRDENGSTGWLWAKLGRGLGRCATGLVNLVFRRS